MTVPQTIVAIVLALTALLALWRSHRRAGRITAIAVMAQLLLALLFFFLLFPPALTVKDHRLAVLTAGVTPAQRRAQPLLQRVVALPEAKSGGDIERVPDLATALRHFPQINAIDVLGDGFTARDQAAVGTRALSFEASTEQGLVELQAPAEAPQGTQWSLSGRALMPAVKAELHDPSGATVDSLTLPHDGRFRLSALARAAGTARYELRLFDSKQALIDTASVPLMITPGEHLSVIIRVGAPDPEFKYWRRWAADSGIETRASAGLSDGVTLRDGDTQLTTVNLAATDLVIIDERAWSTLGADEKAALRTAIEEGLGLLLRADGRLEPQVTADWSALGFPTTNAESPRSITLDQRIGLREREPFTEAPVQVETGDGNAPNSLLNADDGEALALWQAVGKGRIGLWRLIDSYRLTLLGEAPRYGALWQTTIAALSRPKPAETQKPQLPDASWINERSVLCKLGAAASVRPPQGEAATLVIDPQGCAAYWPSQAGWQQLQTRGATFPFYVRAADDAVGWRTARDRDRTRARVRPDDPESSATNRKAILPRWPFFLSWLLLAATLWWRERPR